MLTRYFPAVLEGPAALQAQAFKGLKAEPCRFSAKIRFCSPAEYEAYRPQTYRAYHPTYAEHIQRRKAHLATHPEDSHYPWDHNSIQETPALVTGPIFTCTAGGVTDGRTGVRYDLVPDRTNLVSTAPWVAHSRIKNKLLARCSSLLPQRSALLLGGDRESSNSQILFRHLFRFFQAQGVPVSCFWGQDNRADTRGMEAYYTAQDDTWRILKHKSHSQETIQTLPDLLRSFTAVTLSPTDTLLLKDCPPLSANAVQPLFNPEMPRLATTEGTF